jgi:transcriptional regulator with XRE-family HTH domain
MNAFIRKLRVSRKISQSTVAKQLGISQNAYSRIERGLTRISTERLHQLADIFGTSVHDLLAERERSMTAPTHVAAQNTKSRDDLWIYEKLIQHKDETISSLKETIQLLKEQLETYRTLSAAI